MGQSIKKTLQKEYSHLKKVIEKILTPKKERGLSPLAMQPLRRQPEAGQVKSRENNFH
jgi:hypothetical protein